MRLAVSTDWHFVVQGAWRDQSHLHFQAATVQDNLTASKANNVGNRLLHDMQCPWQAMVPNEIVRYTGSLGWRS